MFTMTMVSLSNTEMNNLLSAISIVNSSVDPQSMPQRTVKAVASLIGYLGISFDTIDKDGALTPDGKWDDPTGVLTDPLYEVLEEYLYEHPLIEGVIARRSSVLRNTDKTSLKSFNKTNLYNEFYKKIDVTHQMQANLPMDDGSLVVCSLSRNRRDFSDSEKMMLELFSPHLRTAIVNAYAVGRIVEEKAYVESFLTTLNSAAIVFGENGNIIQETGSCRAIIHKYFRKDNPDSNAIPENLHKWVDTFRFRPQDEQDLRSPEAALLENGDDQLRIRLVIDTNKREKTLIFEEKTALNSSDLYMLGLTPRESEVLLWISKGKTSAEIAILLNIMPKTVQNHTAMIFEKLGVETRTAAMLRVQDLTW